MTTLHQDIENILNKVPPYFQIHGFKDKSKHPFFIILDEITTLSEKSYFTDIPNVNQIPVCKSQISNSIQRIEEVLSEISTYTDVNEFFTLAECALLVLKENLINEEHTLDLALDKLKDDDKTEKNICNVDNWEMLFLTQESANTCVRIIKDLVNKKNKTKRDSTKNLIKCTFIQYIDKQKYDKYPNRLGHRTIIEKFFPDMDENLFPAHCFDRSYLFPS